MEYVEGTARHYHILDYDIHMGVTLMVEELGMSVVTGLGQSRRLRVAAVLGDQFTQPFSLNRFAPEALAKWNAWADKFWPLVSSRVTLTHVLVESPHRCDFPENTGRLAPEYTCGGQVATRGACQVESVDETARHHDILFKNGYMEPGGRDN